MIGLSELVFEVGSLLAAAAAGAGEAVPGADVSKLVGSSQWLKAMSDEHRFFYAAGSVVFLLVLGALVGLLTEAVLSRLGLGTERIERVE